MHSWGASAGAVRRVLLALVLGCLGAVALPPTAASGHADLADALPGPGDVVRAVPATVTLEFTEPLVGVHHVTVTHLDHRVDRGAPTLDASRTVVTAELAEVDADGPVRVEYRAASADGHLVEGVYEFRVVARATDPPAPEGAGVDAAAATPTATQTPSTAPAVAATALPIGVGALAAIGVLCLATLANRRNDRSTP